MISITNSINNLFFWVLPHAGSVGPGFPLYLFAFSKEDAAAILSTEFIVPKKKPEIFRHYNS